MENYNNHNQNMHTNNNQNTAGNEGGDKWGLNLTIAIVAIVVGLLLGYAVFGNKLIDGDTDANTPNATSTTEVIIETDDSVDTTDINTVTSPAVTTTRNMSVVAEDQPANSRVKLSSLELEEGAWVVVFNSTVDGKTPFKIIGAQYFDAGSYTNVTSYIIGSLEAGQTYFITLYKDDGVADPSGKNRHVFNHETDTAFVKDGKWIMDSFTVTASPAVAE